MCGIIGCHSPNSCISLDRARALRLSARLRHRGPDWDGIYVNENAILCHQRLAIVGLDSGAQPFISDDGSYVLGVNGELYGYVHRAMLAGASS
jgi:asparagine synthase (glutamine-hydrolysing)